MQDELNDQMRRGGKKPKLLASHLGGYFQSWRQSQAPQLHILQGFNAHLAALFLRGDLRSKTSTTLGMGLNESESSRTSASDSKLEKMISVRVGLAIT